MTKWKSTQNAGSRHFPSVATAPAKTSRPCGVISASTVYAEVGPATTTAYGGVTVDFVGTGGSVCICIKVDKRKVGVKIK